MFHSQLVLLSTTYMESPLPQTSPKSTNRKSAASSRSKKSLIVKEEENKSNEEYLHADNFDFKVGIRSLLTNQWILFGIFFPRFKHQALKLPHQQTDLLRRIKFTTSLKLRWRRKLRGDPPKPRVK